MTSSLTLAVSITVAAAISPPSAATQPSLKELTARWEARLVDEGLAPLDEPVRGRSGVARLRTGKHPRKSIPEALQAAMIAFAHSPAVTESERSIALAWAVDGLSVAELARRAGCAYTVMRKCLEALKQRAQASDVEPPPDDSEEALDERQRDILELFADAQGWVPDERKR